MGCIVSWFCGNNRVQEENERYHLIRTERENELFTSIYYRKGASQEVKSLSVETDLVERFGANFFIGEMGRFEPE